MELGVPLASLHKAPFGQGGKDEEICARPKKTLYTTASPFHRDAAYEALSSHRVQFRKVDGSKPRHHNLHTGAMQRNIDANRLLLLVLALACVRLPCRLLLGLCRRRLRSGLWSGKQVRLRSPVICALVGLQDAPD